MQCLATRAGPTQPLAGVEIQHLELQGVGVFVREEEESLAIAGKALRQKASFPGDRQEQSGVAFSAVVQNDFGRVRIEVAEQGDAVAARCHGGDPKSGRRDE